MITKLRKVGNSRGVILPAPWRIILEAPVATRQGWFDGYSSKEDVSVWGDVAELDSTEEWEW